MAGRITSLTSLAFDYAKGRPGMDAIEVNTLLTELIRFEIAAFEHSRALAGPRSLAQAELAAARERALQDTLREAIFLRNWEIARAPLQSVASRLGVALPSEFEGWNALAIETTRVLLDVSQERARRDRGEYDSASPIFLRSQSASVPSKALQRHPVPVEVAPATFASTASTLPTGLSAANAPAEQPRNSEQQAPITKPQASQQPTLTSDTQEIVTAEASKTPPRTTPLGGEPIRKAFQMFHDARCAGKPAKEVSELSSKSNGEKFKKNMAKNLMGTMKILNSLWPNIAMSQLTEEHMIETFDLIQRMPKNHGKSCNETHDIRELVAQTDAKEQKAIQMARKEQKAQGASLGNIELAEYRAKIPRLSVNTVYRHMQDVQRVIRYMIAHGAMTQNLMKRVIWPSKTVDKLLAQQEDNRRQPWDEKLSDLFRTETFQQTGDKCVSVLFWATLIAVLSGMRAEEVLQLSTDDIRVRKGIAFFDIKVGAGQSLKSAAAVREIPIHRSLIELGFLEFVEMRRGEKEHRLFPDLTRGKTRESLSEVFTKDFTRYRQKHNIYEKNRDFHSLRTQFNHEMMRNRVDSQVRNLLMGHEIHDVNFKHYGKEGYGLDYLQDVVNGVEIDTSMIPRPHTRSRKSNVLHLATSPRNSVTQ